MEANELEPGQMVKTKGGDLVEVFTVRHFNNTVSIGHSRKSPLLVSCNEIESIEEEA